jgi:hypothetical protein
MSAPNTPLMVAPADAPNPFGQFIQSGDLIRRLTKLNKRIFCPDINDANHIEAWHGVTSLWLGTPDGGGKPICGLRLGPIPEWTQISDEGILITKGWRAIFDKVIRSGAISAPQLEVEFGVTLSYGKADANLCPKCVKEGRRTSGDGGARGYCEMHTDAYDTAARAKASGREIVARATHRRKRLYNVG